MGLCLTPLWPLNSWAPANISVISLITQTQSHNPLTANENDVSPVAGFHFLRRLEAQARQQSFADGISKNAHRPKLRIGPVIRDRIDTRLHDFRRSNP